MITQLSWPYSRAVEEIMLLGTVSTLARKPLFRRRNRPGAAPGSVLADPDAPPPRVRAISFGGGRFVEQEITDCNEIEPLLDEFAVTWINVDGLGDAKLIRRLADLFGLHPLEIEDIVHVHQRAKVEDYGDHLFLIARMVHLAETPDDDDAEPPDGLGLSSEQLSIFLGGRFVLTFQEAPGDCLDPVRERLRKNVGRLRQAGTDYLTYAILDAVIDSYFPIIEQYAEALDTIEDELDDGGTPRDLARLHYLRRELLTLRRAAWPLREAVSWLMRDSHKLIDDATRVYFRDCADHVFQILDAVGTYRELCSDLREYFFSITGQRTNEVMRLLTIIATIFIPLSFVAGVYGMNFDPEASPWNMPELDWRFGYFGALGIMASIAGVMLTYFWRKGWL
ncbi:magnesium/cobalt transporter CorA [Maioricimonas sp. JC845]|uniref:magnesium/cobalt transporter CorA n=1 Tax=Maioricimonas sp. JC845 TaxID=3232138 RepID=UPI003457C23A